MSENITPRPAASEIGLLTVGDRVVALFDVSGVEGADKQAVDHCAYLLQKKIGSYSNQVHRVNKLVDTELSRLRARVEELEGWHKAIMPPLENLLDRNPEEFGIDGDGEQCWPTLAEFVTRGRVLERSKSK